MLRQTFRLVSGLSLALCIAVVVLWVRSYFKQDGATIIWHDREYYWFSGWGKLAVASHRTFPVLAGAHHAGFSGGTWSRPYGIAPGVYCGVQDLVETADCRPLVLYDANGKRLRHPELEVGNYAIVLHATYRYIGVRHAYLGVLLVILPGWSGSTRLRRWRQTTWCREGRCRICGYNLTRNTSGICPECGTAVVAFAPASPRSK